MSDAIVLPTHKGFKDLTNLEFGKLSVISYAGSLGNGSKAKVSAWLCRCECGAEKVIRSNSLLSRGSKSCGCGKVEASRLAHTKHGMSRSPEYWVWNGMKERCINPKGTSYEIYGGRGIIVCERWLNFENFYADMGPRPSDRHEIDRIDFNGNYEPSNCRWVTEKEQSKNKRSSRFLEFQGFKLTITEWAESSGISRTALSQRIGRGWSVEKALTTPWTKHIRKRR